MLEDLAGKKILIVEDDKINQLIARKMALGLNATVEVADSGERAIALSQENEYDIILMDINMPPGMDGYEAARQIRAINALIPIIAMTALEQEEMEERVKHTDLNGFLIKPLNRTKLLETVAHYC